MEPAWFKTILQLILPVLLGINAYLLLSNAGKLARLEPNAEDPSSELAKLEAPMSTSSELSANIEYLNTRVHMLTNFITDLEVKITGLKGLTESIKGCEPQLKAEAAAQEVLAVSRLSDGADTHAPVASAPDTDLPADESAAYGNTKQSEAAAAQHPALAPTPAGNGAHESWVINVASLDNQPAADRFSARARARGVPVQQQIVTLKGKRRWRMQVTGFATSTEARIKAGPIKEKLGLQDVWITQR